jgi:predicted transcriptional regulator
MSSRDPHPAGRGGDGGREHELLRWVAARGAATVGEAAAGFGSPRALARTTVQTMLERLHKKGRLKRQRRDGVHHYSSVSSAAQLAKDLVKRLVDGPLGGSLQPFAAYLAEARNLEPDELAALERVVAELRAAEGAPASDTPRATPRAAPPAGRQRR